MPQNKPGPSNGVKVKGKDDGCCGIFFLKYVVYVFNLIFWISGGALVAVGLWTLLAKPSYAALLSSSVYPSTVFLLIGTGGFIILVGFLGCCGAWHENAVCLMTYAAFLLLIFLLEAVVGVLAYMYEAALQGELTRSLNQTMLSNYKIDSAMTVAIDDMQQSFKCCGAGFYEDWKGSRWLQSHPSLNLTCPDSCCYTMSPNCATSSSPNNIFYDGCTDFLHKHLKRQLVIIGSVGLGVCCLQLFGIVFACILAMKIKQWKRRQKTNYWS